MVVIIPRRIGLMIKKLYPSQERIPSRPGGLMTSTALTSSRRTARKASRMRKKLSSNESKSKINLTSWIACIRSYTENNGMETIFRIYDPYLKTGVYLLDDWGAAKDGKVSKWVQTLTTTGVRYVQVNCLPIFNFD